MSSHTRIVSGMEPAAWFLSVLRTGDILPPSRISVIRNIMRTSFNPGLIMASVAALLLSACGSSRPVPAPEQTKAAHPVKPTAVPTSLARQTCPEWHPPEDGKDYGPATKPVAVPEQFRSIVSSSKTVITVQGIGEKPGCVKLSWIDSISGLELSSDKRFLGFETSGFEAMG